MTSLIIAAAGSGQRLGAGIPKALVTVAGNTLLGHCLAVAEGLPEIAAVVVVVPANERDQVTEAVGQSVRVVAGGDTRDASVRAGLDALPEGEQLVLIHDAARPFTPPEVYLRVIAALESGAQAVIPGLPVIDTIKQVNEDLVVHTIDRSDLVAVQTPQGFRVEGLRQAHVKQVGAVTDDAMLMEQLGTPVHVVQGAPEAFKITTPFDLAVARALREG